LSALVVVGSRYRAKREETPISRDFRDANPDDLAPDSRRSVPCAAHARNQSQAKAVNLDMNTRYAHLALLAVVLVAVVLLATGCGGGGSY
jgi:hypothetical protein